MGSIEIFVVFAVAALDLAVMSGSVGLYEFVADATLFEARLEQCGRGILGIAQPLCKFSAVIRLHTLYLKWEFLNEMFQKYCGTVGAVFLKSF